ncbi:MAG TPA: hypothetical protein VHM27_12425 [Rhizomicrobium sp.]|jgi:hypothetical protein|nr:hypothetical protein [Rhizomicrobium sp.]
MATGKEGSKVAETARLERAQGGQPQAHDSGDPHTNRVPDGGAAGPHNKPEHVNKDATPGSGVLPEPGKADDDGMAPTG